MLIQQVFKPLLHFVALTMAINFHKVSRLTVRKHRGVALCLSIIVTISALAAEREPTQQVRADAIRSHVEFLASDLLEGRAAASRGYDIAAAYAAAQLRQYGLSAAGENDTYFQTVPLLEATAVLPGSEAEWTHEGKTHRFEYGTDYLPSADFHATSSSLTAPLVFVGFGIEAPEQEHNDFAGVDVQGRIAVLFSGAPTKFPHHLRAYHSWTVTKFNNLIQRGAVGAVIIDSPDDARRVPWQRAVAMSWVPQMRWLDETGEPNETFPKLKLRFRFTPDAAARWFDAADRDFAEILKRVEAGEAQGFTLPGMLTLSATTGLRRTESTNVLGVLQGADAKLKHEYLIVSAHLDHLGRGAAVNGDSTYNGAHDNALGVAIVLEMARSLSVNGVRPKRSILFALFTAEEKGLLGSSYLVHHPTHTGQPVANINIDMPMVFAPTRDWIALGEPHSTLGTLAASAAASLGFKLSPDPFPEEVAFIRSDQFSFIRAGIPALLLYSGQEARDRNNDLGALMREYLATHYHQPSDDTKLPLDYSAAADLARLNLKLIVEAANAPTRPKWKPGDFFGERFGN